MSQQGLRQASVRAVTGTANTYEGDWHALFDLASIPAGPFNGRLLAWINQKLSASYTNLPDAQQALAVANGAANFSSMGTFDAGSGSASVLSAFNAEGWSATYPSVPAGPSLLETTSLTRTGYDSTGALGTRADTHVITYRKRQAYPNDGSLTASDVALSTWVCASDSLAGVTNNSALTSPKPVCLWTMFDREVVGNAVTLRVKAYHWAARLGKQVACVKFIATDGTNTASQIVTATTATAESLSGFYVEEYVCALDITSLNAGMITCNAEAYPWVAAADGSSVAKSVDGTSNRGFSPRYFLKDLERCVGGSKGPPTAIVDTAAGNDTTGTWGTEASPGLPFATIQGAINTQATASRSMTAAGYANNNLDGAQVLCKAGTHVLAAATTTRAQALACVKIGREASAAAASDVVIQMTSWRARLGVTGMALPSNEGGVLFEGVTVQRTGAGTFQGESGSDLEVFFKDCTFDNGSVTSAWLTSTSNDLHWGTTFTNLAGSVLGSAGGVDSTEHRMFRGCTAANQPIDRWLVIGNRFTGCNTSAGARTDDGSIVAETAFYACTGETWNVAGYNSWAISSGAVLANCIIEAIHTNDVLPGIGVSRDGSNMSTVQVIVVNNTILGAGSLGRANLLYCDKGTTGTVRTHTFSCVKGNIFPGAYVKGDQFVGTNNNGSPDPVDAPNFIGHLPWVYAVNGAGNVQMWQTAANGLNSAEGPIYIGAGSLRPGAGVLTELPNVNFVDPKQTTYNGSAYSAGAGQGDYRLNTGSVALGIVADAVLGFTLNGAARPTSNDNAGALGAAA